MNIFIKKIKEWYGSRPEPCVYVLKNGNIYYTDTISWSEDRCRDSQKPSFYARNPEAKIVKMKLVEFK